MKQELINLARKLGFNSQMFTDTDWKYSSKEDLRYYLWMCELQKWLCEKHNVHIYIIPLSRINFSYNYFKDGGYTFSYNGFSTYEQALEAVLVKSLNLINNE